MGLLVAPKAHPALTAASAVAFTGSGTSGKVPKVRRTHLATGRPRPSVLAARGLRNEQPALMPTRQSFFLGNRCPKGSLPRFLGIEIFFA